MTTTESPLKNPSIRCKNCLAAFSPALKASAKEGWQCPHCQTKNPQLKRLYRSFADLCIMGLIVTCLIVLYGISNDGVTLGSVISIGHGVLLLVTTIVVYSSVAPWQDRVAKTLIWATLTLACLFNVVILCVSNGLLVIPAVVLYSLVFGYLVWLTIMTKKCTLETTPPAER